MSKKRFGRKHAPKAPNKKITQQGNRNARRRLPEHSVDSNSDDGIEDEEQRIAHKRSGGDTGGLLTSKNPKEIKNDLKLLERAVRNRWGIKRKNTIVRRLYDVIGKTSVVTMTKGGPFDSEERADANAIAAAKVLAMLNGQDQADDQWEEKLSQDKPPAVNVTVNQVNVNDRTIELARLAQSLGARELVVSGQRVTPEHYLESVDPVQKAQTSTE